MGGGRTMASGLRIVHSIDENRTAMHLRLESWALWPVPLVLIVL